MRFWILFLSLSFFIVSTIPQKHCSLLAQDEPAVAMCWGKPWVLADTAKWDYVYNDLDILKIYIGNIDTRIGQDTVRSFIESLFWY